MHMGHKFKLRGSIMNYKLCINEILPHTCIRSHFYLHLNNIFLITDNFSPVYIVRIVKFLVHLLTCFSL